MSERSELSVLPVHLPQMRPPSFWPGSICHLPPTRGGPTNKRRRRNQKTGPDSTSSLLPVAILVNSPGRLYGRNQPYRVSGFFLQKKGAALRSATGSPPEDVLRAKRICLPVFLPGPSRLPVRRRPRRRVRFPHFLRPQDL